MNVIVRVVAYWRKEIWRVRPPQKFYYVLWAHGDAVMCGKCWYYLREECECVVGGVVGV